ncbi:MAG: ATP-dependent DNA helicase RecG [Bacteroidia bacterium]
MMQSDFWKIEIMYLKKIGPQRAKILASEVNIRSNEDLLHYYPRKYIEKGNSTKISDIKEEGVYTTLMGKLVRMEEVLGKNNKKRLTAVFTDGSGFMELVWFQGISFIKPTLKLHEELAIFGRPTIYGNMVQMSHPELDWLKPLPDNPQEGIFSNPNTPKVPTSAISPFYSSTELLGKMGLDSRGFRTIMKTLLEVGEKHIEETLSEEIMQANNLISRKEALKNIHFPENAALLKAAQRRLKFEEFFFFQLFLAKKRRQTYIQNRSNAFDKIGQYFNDFYENHLPFSLTGAQKKVLKEIRKDLSKPVQMNRLVQGDVGSGKTIVAFMVMLMAKDNGFQSVLMAPTEILAEQHYRQISQYSEKIGLKVAYVVGSQKKSERNRHLEMIASGEADIAIGTHALIEDTVVFAKLGLSIVDEQHKFGVQQRAKLWQKAFPYPHNLVMTATPIPRTLAMTVYGDIEVSIIDELPPGRTPIKTIACYESKRLEIIGFIRKEIQKGRQAYVVYPLVEESEKLDLLAVEKGYELLSEQFPECKVGIVHGKMPSENKEFEMQRFLKNETNILVSTTVIEVGVDVPNSTMMVIENAERFGLSQLHQLRGRVGRGKHQSYCILMTANKRSADARKRLKVMVETNDGFKISEFDLEIRGPGDFLGTRQSGVPEFQIADIVQDQAALQEARAAAFELIESDPDLLLPQNEIVKNAYLPYQKNMPH